MIQKLNTENWVKVVNNGLSGTDCYKPSFKGAFSFAGSLSVFDLSQSVIKTGRGSRPFAWLLASSSYSPNCKYRKEVMRQR